MSIYRDPPDARAAATQRLEEAEARQKHLEHEHATSKAELESHDEETAAFLKQVSENGTDVQVSIGRSVCFDRKAFRLARVRRAEISLAEHAPDLELARQEAKRRGVTS